MDPLTYLSYLRSKVEGLGARIIRTKLPIHAGIEGAAAEAAKLIGLKNLEAVRAVVNATGLGAMDMVKDDSLYPIRGQTIRVKGVAKECITRLGASKSGTTAVMPRPGSNCTVIGVTVEPDIGKTDIEDDQVSLLLNRAKPFASELIDQNGDFTMLKVGVGLRPGRSQGARVELEESPAGFVIAHAYGHAGAG